jgi:anti-anti-sigma regulatory factor
VLITLLTGIGTPEPFVTKASALIVLVPTSIALILARPAWIIGSMVGVLAIYSLRGGPANYFVNAYIGDLRTLGTVIFLVGCMFLSRLVAETAQRAAEAAAERADLARAEAEQKAGLLVQQAEDLAVRNEEQSRLLALVDTLEVAAVALDDGILLAPLIGRVDQRRLDILTERLLKQATLQRTLLVILDVAGVPSISATVAVALGRLAQALQLVGCTVMITGLTSTVAQTLTAEGVGFPGVATIRAPQEALALWRARGVAVPPA